MNIPYLPQSQLAPMGLKTENSMIQSIDINLIGHFGNVVSVEVKTRHCTLLNAWNATRCLGVVLQCLYDLLDLTEENGKRLSEVRDVPCRVVVDNKTGFCVGLGNFMDDNRFLMFDDMFNCCAIWEKRGMK